jgi:hypothetical protein
MLFVAIVGAATAIFAATIGIAQNDIKKVLAYSTVSQLGYMFLAAGVGAYVAAIFHLATHAFFKALLFLGSGSVIHAMGGEQDMRKMGGLRKQLPWTYRTFLVGTLAISGVPLLAGFFSKDAILGAAFERSPILWIVGLATAALTACYMLRVVFLTFFGKFRGTHEQEHHLHESPAVMVVPLVVLAAGVRRYAGKIPFTHSTGSGLLAWLSWPFPAMRRMPPPRSRPRGDPGRGAPAAAAAGLIAWRSGGATSSDEVLARAPRVYRLSRTSIRRQIYDRSSAARSARLLKVIDSVFIDGGPMSRLHHQWR